MAVIDKYDVLSDAFRSAGVIHMHADWLRGQSGSISFGHLRGRLDAMRQAYDAGVQPMLDLGSAAQINPQIGTFFVSSTMPGNPYAQFQLIGTRLGQLYAAYDVVFDTLTPIEFDPVTGHSEADIPLVQLASLADELDAVISAAAPLI
jgi:hypothetical protein